MITVDYIGILIRKNNRILYQLTNPNIVKKYGEINYLEIITELNLDFIQEIEEITNGNDEEIKKEIKKDLTERENAGGIPELVKYKSPKGDSEENLFYNFVIRNNLVLICVTSEFFEELRPLLLELLIKIDSYFISEKINELDESNEPNQLDEQSKSNELSESNEPSQLDESISAEKSKENINLNNFVDSISLGKNTKNKKSLLIEYIKCEFSILFANQILSELFVPSIHFQEGDTNKQIKKHVENQENDKDIVLEIDHEMEQEKERITIKTKKMNIINTRINEFNNFLLQFGGLKNSDTLKGISLNIDGILNIKSLSEKIKIDVNLLTTFFFRLGIENLIQFRFPIYNWNVFERTHRANKYLFDGSDEQKFIINKFNGGKIISLLSRLDGKSSLDSIKKRMKITELNIERYIHELLEMGAIKLIKKYPKIEEIADDMLPLLVIQGLSEDEVMLLEDLKIQFDGKKTITDVALKLEGNPEKIYSILGKIKDFVKFDTF